jgi:rSAM/selenodomain-associated transferase 1
VTAAAGTQVTPGTVIVLAKAPVPGRVKTRLCPPCTPAEAATLARAALHDVVAAALIAAPGNVVVALDGAPPRRLRRPGVRVVPQRGTTLDERIAAAFEQAGGPAVLVGMDSPQIDAATLRGALSRLATRDAVLGLCDDGGFWAVGVREPRRELFTGVPMGNRFTGARQLAQLRLNGLDVALLPARRDVDVAADARAVAARAPHTRFARAVSRMPCLTPVGNAAS